MKPEMASLSASTPALLRQLTESSIVAPPERPTAQDKMKWAPEYGANLRQPKPVKGSAASQVKPPVKQLAARAYGVKAASFGSTAPRFVVGESSVAPGGHIFAKALRDPALEVRRNGVTALGLLAPLSTRLDALVTDLSSGATADDAPDAVAAACLKGLAAVFGNATGPKPPSDASRDAARDAAEALAGHEDPEVSKAAAALSGVLG